MDFYEKVSRAVTANHSLVCVGLDSELSKLPKHLSGPDAQFEFNKAIIDATKDLVCAFKPNSAFYEAQGAAGLEQLKKTCDYIRKAAPDIPIILDAKRADIGNTNQGYIDYAFDYLSADAITIHPYMGGESLEPFLARADKGIIVLCRTSNPGSGELQNLEINGKKLYQIVAEKVSQQWNSNKNCCLVIGATYPQELADIRKLCGDDILLLIPGVGAQGGDVEQTVKAGVNSRGEGIMVNSSRAIIFASNGEDFAQAAAAEAAKLREEINKYRGATHE